MDQRQIKMQTVNLSHPVGTTVKLRRDYEFLTAGRTGTIQEFGRTAVPGQSEPERTIIINLGDGMIELDQAHFELFEVVGSETVDAVTLIDPKTLAPARGT